MNKQKSREIRRLMIRLAVVAAGIVCLLVFPLTLRVVQGNAMYPAVRDGELVIISKIAKISGGAVVLYRTGDGTERLGRIAADGGSIVEISEAGLIVDGFSQYQTIPYQTPAGSLEYPYQVADDSCFIINDYRSQTEDSRTFGGIERKNICGVVIFAMQYRAF